MGIYREQKAVSNNIRTSNVIKRFALLMIRIFLKGLPYTLTQPMFREFESKQRELSGWSRHTRSRRIQMYLEQKESIEYIFALGIYYRYVIAPLTRTGAFFERIQERDIPSLLVGGKEIGPEFQQSISNAGKHLNKILDDYGLSESFFSTTG